MRRSGRGIRRIVTLCGTITQLVAENDRRLVEADPDSSSSDNDEEENDEDGDGDGGHTLERKDEIRK